MTVQRLPRATNRKSVPRTPIYFSGWRRPTSSICFSMPVTTISRRFCQRERSRPVESLRVMSFEPTASTSISPHVNTMVALSLRNPCCQKIISSGLRRMAGLRCRAVLVFSRRPGQPGHDQACHDKSKETQEQPLPMTARDKVKSSQGNAHPQQQAAEEPQRRLFGRNALATRPPKAAEENRTEQKARHQRECQSQQFIHRHPPVRPALPCPPWRPNATHSNSRSRAPQSTAPASRHACPDGVCPTRYRAPRRAASGPPPTSRQAPSCPSRTRRPARSY